MFQNAFYSALNEPAVANPPVRVWRDWALLAASVSIAAVEAIVRPDIGWRPASVLVALALLATLLWRRAYPLAMLAITLVTLNVFSLIALPFTETPVNLYTAAFTLILVYAVFRWDSGRNCAIAIVLMVAALLVSLVTDYTGLGDAIGGALVLFLPAELGALVRNRATSLQQRIDETKLREREQLARELHDTVAHHVSAIAIRAQAGRAVAATNPDAAVDALKVIEEEASRTLSEMRTIVGALRGGETAEMAPQPGVGDIEKLASDSTASLPVMVELTGDFDSLRPSIDTALYRIAQESITNSIRHARRASAVNVSVVGDAESVRLTVSDDGQDGSGGPGTAVRDPGRLDHANGNGSQRFGLVGMAERAKLLGGVFWAGPNPDGGWMVDVVFPRGA